MTQKTGHTEDCPKGQAHVLAYVPCPECGGPWHPTEACVNCGHSLCWCVEEDDQNTKS